MRCTLFTEIIRLIPLSFQSGRSNAINYDMMNYSLPPTTTVKLHVSVRFSESVAV